MVKMDLGGIWQFQESGADVWLPGTLPGCNYLDLMKNGLLADPFRERNEEAGKLVSEKDYAYRRTFEAPAALLSMQQVELTVSGLDTLAVLSLNGTVFAETDNVNRTYRFEIRDLLHAGLNTLHILFRSPLPYLKTKQEADRMPFMGMGADGLSHLRKTQCHFGWDWGPNLAPAGIFGHIGLEGWDLARIQAVEIQQAHSDGHVDLDIRTEVERTGHTPHNSESAGAKASLAVRCKVTSPDGVRHEAAASCHGEEKTILSLRIANPLLWWSNGLGGQPLYQVEVSLWEASEGSPIHPAVARVTTGTGALPPAFQTRMGTDANPMDSQVNPDPYALPLDTWTRNIGLRTLTLDTRPDEWGNNFRFHVNGVPIFAKGADWIPTDSFVTRTTEADLDFYVRSARDANMNMFRVWGGGYYESDAFYDLCDRYGLLVWQDFAFACMLYPLHKPEFRESVRHEVEDNVRRIRHHASLALWCGNNEIELIGAFSKKLPDIREAGNHFFHEILPEWVKEHDAATPYWPGSPTSGIRVPGTQPEKPNHLGKGDTHLWLVWHGMLPIESFRKYPTRFCSEFGMESLPSLDTIRLFTEDPEVNLFSPVMLAHQKSGGGNQKMLFYLLAKYRNPASFEDFLYLSQIVQAETVRNATEFWRRNTGRCNGSLYWQYNDCWPVASWAGIDYGKRFKAVQYKAQHFNRMQFVSGDLYRDHADIHVVNDLPESFEGTVKWVLSDFNGGEISAGNLSAMLGSNQAKCVGTLRFADILKGKKKNQAVLQLSLHSKGGRTPLSVQTHLLVPDKQAKLRVPLIHKNVTISGSTATLTLTSDSFARYVEVQVKGLDQPLSDNFFDIGGGGSYQITFPVQAGLAAEALTSRIRVRSLADVKPTGSPLNDMRLRLAMRLDRNNILMWLVFKFIA